MDVVDIINAKCVRERGNFITVHTSDTDHVMLVEQQEVARFVKVKVILLPLVFRMPMAMFMRTMKMEMYIQIVVVIRHHHLLHQVEHLAPYAGERNMNIRRILLLQVLPMVGSNHIIIEAVNVLFVVDIVSIIIIHVMNVMDMEL